MAIVFDPEKDRINVLKHGVSLSFAEDLEIWATIEDDRRDYGEARYRAFGVINGVAHCLVFTTRGQAVRAISLRRAHSREMRRHAPR